MPEEEENIYLLTWVSHRALVFPGPSFKDHCHMVMIRDAVGVLNESLVCYKFTDASVRLYIDLSQINFKFQ